jgi:omega-amidase
MKVATISFDQSWENKKANMKLCENFIIESSKILVDLVIFPEMTLTAFSPKSANSLLEDLSNSKSLNWFGKMSKKYEINIIFGALLKEKGSKLPKNMLCIAEKDGSVKALYAKMHVFSFAKEDLYVASGDKYATYKIGDINFGLAICYDLRFPELFSTMAKTCEVIIIIANWPSSRFDHWNILLKARAIENECIVFGVNRTGVDGNNIDYEDGNSIMVLPDGTLGESSFISQGLNIYNIDKNQVQGYRKRKLSSLKDKKYFLYEDILRENNKNNPYE